MPLSDRDYLKGEHPPTCTCVDCVSKRLGIIQHKKHTKSPKDERKLKFTYSPKKQESVNEEIPQQQEHPVEEQSQTPPPTNPPPHQPPHINNKKIHNWLIALLLIFSLSIIGLGISYFVGSFIPLWIIFGFSFIYSVEKWFSYITRKHKGIGKLYRLLLNLSILSVFGLIIWSGIKLFSQQLAQSSLIGSLVFLGEFVFFIWIWRVVSKNSWRWPSMKLTIFSLVAITVVFAFAGVQPMSVYKDDLVDKWNTYQLEQKVKTEERLAQAKIEEQKRLEEQKKISEKTVSVPTPTFSVAPKIPTVVPKVTSAPLPTIETTALKNPSWGQLLDFLRADKTDEMPYIYPTFVCDNFANTLQSNAKKAGWRCAKVEVELSGYPDWYKLGIPSNTGHACNAFETTDKGLVYIDCTGPIDNSFPPNCDKMVEVKVGNHYIPISIFPVFGWSSTWYDCGIITSIDIRW